MDKCRVIKMMSSEFNITVYSLHEAGSKPPIDPVGIQVTQGERERGGVV